MAIPTNDVVQNSVLVADQAFTFANSAAVNNVQKCAEVDLPQDGSGTRDGVIFVSNPSQQSDLTCRVYTKQTLNGNNTWGLLAVFNVPKSLDNYNPNNVNKISVAAVPLTGLFCGEKICLVMSNNTALDAAGTFTGHATIRKA